jgi:Domain of unknown function (DUF1905)/Bacteriocin-protection, YdeI or OmpD-Associated
LAKMKEYNFTAVLEDAGGNTGGVFVRFPYDAKKEFGKGRVPIRCTIDGEAYRGTMVKYGAPYYMILVLKSIREKMKKEPGDHVTIWLIEDTDERKMPIPGDFARLLEKNKILSAFKKLSFTHQREYITWIESAKKTETRLARMDKAIIKLQEKK